MAVGTIAAIAGGVGAIGGAIKGAQGTPEQVKDTYRSETSKTTFDPASEQELALQRQSLENYFQQQQMANQYEQGIAGGQGVQGAAQRGYQDVLGGGAFNLSPEEQMRISETRQALIAQGETDVNRMLDQRLQALQGSAASRGVRGQALSQLQTGALESGAQQMGDITRQANLIAAQQAQQAPLARIQAQSPLMAQGLSFADQMRIQAQQNRMAAQSPYMLSALRAERAATGTTTRSGTERNVTPGTEGSFGDALTGGFAGAAGAVKGVSDIRSSMGDLFGGRVQADSNADVPGYTSPQFGSSLRPKKGPSLFG